MLLEKFTKDGELPGFLAKAGMGLTAGAIGAFCGTPADVALIRVLKFLSPQKITSEFHQSEPFFKTQTLIRMCVDNRLPEAERRNYKSVFDAWRRIAGEEGIFLISAEI